MTKIVAKYVGGGAFLSGVPARDLEDGDWARLSGPKQDLVKLSPLYEMVEPEKKPAKKTKRGK